MFLNLRASCPPRITSEISDTKMVTQIFHINDVGLSSSSSIFSLCSTNTMPSRHCQEFIYLFIIYVYCESLSENSLLLKLPGMSSLSGGDALAPTSTVPPVVNTSDSSSQQVNDSTSSAGPPAPVVLLSPAPAAGNGSVLGPFPPGSGSSNKSTLVALGVGIGIGGAIVLVCVGIFVLWYKRRKRRLGLDGVSHAPLHGPKGEKIFIVATHRVISSISKGIGFC